MLVKLTSVLAVVIILGVYLAYRSVKPVTDSVIKEDGDMEYEYMELINHLKLMGDEVPSRAKQVLVKKLNDSEFILNGDSRENIRELIRLANEVPSRAKTPVGKELLRVGGGFLSKYSKL